MRKLLPVFAFGLIGIHEAAVALDHPKCLAASAQFDSVKAQQEILVKETPFGETLGWFAGRAWMLFAVIRAPHFFTDTRYSFKTNGKNYLESFLNPVDITLVLGGLYSFTAFKKRLNQLQAQIQIAQNQCLEECLKCPTLRPDGCTETPSRRCFCGGP